MSTTNHGSSVQGHTSSVTRDSQERDTFLQPSSAEVELTKQDRQEGYELPSAFAERAPATARPSTDEKRVPASSLPYQSRPSNPVETSKPRARIADTQPRSREGARRRSRRQISWWKKPSSLIIFAVLLSCFALGIGLGVGLGTKRGTPVVSEPASTTRRESSVVPEVSKTEVGVSVSQSAAPTRAAREARARRMVVW